MPVVAVAKKNYPRQIRNYSVFIFFILMVAGVYGYMQYTKLAAAQEALNKGQTLTDTLRSSSVNFEGTYTDLKKLFDEDFKTISDSIQAVYPSEESYTKLTRLLDDFMQQNNKSFDPIFMSDLKFSQSRVEENSDYSILPFTLTLSTSRSNFEKFLRFVENSGALGDGSRQAGIRLMDIQSISLNFSTEPSAFASPTPETTTTVPVPTVPLLNVSVALNAYFQAPTNASVTPR